jgi:23S rRNA (adenine1618-N6)-methyltransferase
MSSDKKQQVKARLHPRNRNRERYDLNALIDVIPELNVHVRPNKFGANTIDFSDPKAIKMLNQGLLNHYYGIKHWDFPEKNLCPPIPGRADYIHYVADLLSESNFGKVPIGEKVTCLDIGIGANCIYPIIGVSEYQWKFIGSDVDVKSIESAENIIDANPSLTGKIECRLQSNPTSIFRNILKTEEIIDITICNPPFHSSLKDAQTVTQRKVKNLSGNKIVADKVKLAGVSNELICDGGEIQFLQNIIKESKQNGQNCFWFTTLVSKQSNLKAVYRALDRVNPYQIKTIPMGTGNKTTRIVAWTFQNKEAQKKWRLNRWNA